MATLHDTRVSETTRRRLALADPQGQLELYRGQLRKKPGKSVAHGDVMMRLTEQLLRQLDRGAFHIRVQHARRRVSPDTYSIPDIAVMPTAVVLALREHPSRLAAYTQTRYRW